MSVNAYVCNSVNVSVNVCVNVYVYERECAKINDHKKKTIFLLQKYVFSFKMRLRIFVRDSVRPFISPWVLN